MYFIYSLVLTVGFILLSPWFLFRIVRHGKYLNGFRERLGFVPYPKKPKPLIWLHCVSVGETQAARPLVKALREKLPETALVVSTTTLTGQTLAQQVFNELADAVIYFPFDWDFTVRRTLDRLSPAAVLLMETEIWPGFLKNCEQRQIPVMLVNGRISGRSFNRYRLIKPFVSRLLRTIERACMQSEGDKNRIVALGMAEDKVFNTGNLKFDVGTNVVTDELAAELRKMFFSSARPLIVAASTHSPEEKILLEVFRQVYAAAELQKPRLLIAPRHPERFAEVESLLAGSGFTFVRRSRATGATAANDFDLILLDTIGELPATFPIAHVVFVGGSLSRTGGHNILEPAAVGSCIVTGSNTSNFKAIVRAFVSADAIIQLPPFLEQDTRAIATVFSNLLSNSEIREGLKARAQSLVERNRGATGETMEVVLPVLTQAIAAAGQLPSSKRKVHSA
jgi:3-deoxy-D-manno-octulosonic-acid transferase